MSPVKKKKLRVGKKIQASIFLFLIRTIPSPHHSRPQQRDDVWLSCDLNDREPLWAKLEDFQQKQCLSEVVPREDAAALAALAVEEAGEGLLRATWARRRRLLRWARSCTLARARWCARASTLPRFRSSTPLSFSRTRPTLARSTRSWAPSTRSTLPSSRVRASKPRASSPAIGSTCPATSCCPLSASCRSRSLLRVPRSRRFGSRAVPAALVAAAASAAVVGVAPVAVAVPRAVSAVVAVALAAAVVASGEAAVVVSAAAAAGASRVAVAAGAASVVAVKRTTTF